jgi:hypothetical protein
MALSFPPGQLAVRLEDVLNRFLQACAGIFERSLLNIAAKQLLDEPDPPLADLLEHAAAARRLQVNNIG